MTYAIRPKRARALFWLAFLAGVAACTVDGISHTEIYGWLHPVSIGGAIFGVGALVLAANVLFKGPVSERVSLFALLSIVVLKVILARLYALPL